MLDFFLKFSDTSDEVVDKIGHKIGRQFFKAYPLNSHSVKGVWQPLKVHTVFLLSTALCIAGECIALTACARRNGQRPSRSYSRLNFEEQ